MKASPVSAVAFGLVIVTVSTDDTAVLTGFAEKDCEIVGGASTVNVAVLLDEPALPVCVDATPPLVLS